MVIAMSEKKSTEPFLDPAGNTEAFQAFARGTTAEVPSPQRSAASIAVAVIGALIIVGVAIFFIAR
jgi:hypothetical protein